MSNNLKGSISIFVAIIAMSLIFFTGTIIDIVRITVAQNKVDSAFSTSCRSIMADYDKNLIGEFGVFAVDTHSNSQLLKDELFYYLDKNLTQSNEGFRFLEYFIDKEMIQIQGVGSLLNEDILKAQVLEYMKYKAPILMTENIVNKLNVSKLNKKIEFAESATTVRNNAEKIRKQITKLNNKLNNVIVNITNMSELELSSVLKQLNELNQDIKSNKNNRDLESYFKAISKMESIAHENSFEGNNSHEFDNITNNQNILSQNIDKASQLIEETQKKIKILKTKIKEQELLYKSSEDELLKNSIRNAILDYEIKIDNNINKLKKQLSNINLESINESTEDDEDLHYSKSEDESYESKLDYIKSKVFDININQSMLIKNSEFTSTINNDNQNIYSINNSTNYYKNLSSEKKEKENDSILALIKGLSDLAVSSKDKLYLVEYIMDKYTFLTSKTIRNHFFNKGEVEYIISGDYIPYTTLGNSQLNVILRVLSKIWFIRFSINALDYFVYSKIPHPSARLSWALVEGAISASIDMIQLLEGKSISLTPHIKNVKTPYSDYLRILLLLKSESETTRKMQQLMQVNIMDINAESDKNSVRIKDFFSSLEIKSHIKVKLWFLPIMKLDKLGFKGFEDNYYIIHKKIHIAY